MRQRHRLGNFEYLGSLCCIACRHFPHNIPMADMAVDVIPGFTFSAKMEDNCVLTIALIGYN